MPNNKGQRILSFEERQNVLNQYKKKNQQSNTTNSQQNTTNSQESATNPLSKYLTLTEEDRFQNQQNKINAKYDSQINNLNLGKTTQQQQADITRSQLQKYLPYYYKSKGLSGLGLEQSAMLDANANYTNQLGQIESNFTQQKNALENYRQDDLMKAENDYLDRIDKNSMSAYEEVTFPLQNYINDEKLTADEISKTNALLELYKDQMTQTDYNMAENLLENYKTQFGKAGDDNQPHYSDAKDNDFELTDAMKRGDEFVESNGERYLLSTYSSGKPITYSGGQGSKLSRAMIEKGYASMYDKNIPNGTMFTENNQNYMFINGTWYFVHKPKTDNYDYRLGI